MFYTFLKVAIRNVARNRIYTVINIAGLAIGIAVCMIIFMIIKFQTSFDTFHSKNNRIYRVLTEYHHEKASNPSRGKDVPFPTPVALEKDFPQIEQVAPVFASHDDKILIPDENGTAIKAFKEVNGVFFTGPSFFEIFDFPMLAGSFESLEDPNNVLLTQETAEKYFGEWKTALGKTISLEAGGYIFEHGTETLKVSGILADIPDNTDFQLKLVVAYGTGFTGSLMAKSADWEDRTNSGFGCYILLGPNISAESLRQQLKDYYVKVRSPGNSDNLNIQPLKAVHFDTQTGNFSNKTISHALINVLWLIAGFILLIACVNFINLSTAQAVNRAKDICVMKVLGSNKSLLQIQFFTETFFIVAGAVLLAIVTTILALPSVNQLLDLSLAFSTLPGPAVIMFIIVLTIVVTGLAGFYPSFVLSGFNPLNALKSKFTANRAKGLSLRRGLVVLQFIIAQSLIIGTIIIVKQMNFFMNQPLGFDKDAIITVPFRVDTVWFRKSEYLKQQILAVNGVQAISFSSGAPIQDGNDMWSTLKFDHSAEDEDFKVITKFADEEYVPTYKLQIIAGRNLQPSGMTREFLVNESLMKSLGINHPDEILDKEISIWNDQIKCPVVGILKDFNNRSFRYNLAPLLITTNGTMYSQAAIKLDNRNMSQALQSIKTIWEQTLPNFVFEYSFLEDTIAGFYKQQNQLAQLYRVFSAIAIFLSCLGLYGLASYMAIQRIKEVGIHKVFGATSGRIVYMFSKEFVILIVIAFVIAVPVGWYYMHRWLQDYAYRIDISWWIFFAGGLVAAFIALVTISFQALKAANANPVKSLGTE